jgi:O-antigen/teichoic acid export membrane protein
LLFIKINIILDTTILAGFYLLGYGFIELWMKNTVSTEEVYSCLLIIAVGRFMAYFTTPIQSMLMTLNRHRSAAWITVGETLLSIILCVLLIPPYGLIGASIAVATPYIIGRVFILPFVIARYIEIKLRYTAMHIIFYTALSILVIFSIKNYMLTGVPKNIVDLMLWGLVIAVFQMVLSISIWSSDERQWIKKFFKEKLNGTF